MHDDIHHGNFCYIIVHVEKSSKKKSAASTPETGKLLPNGGYPMHSFEDVREKYCAYIFNPADREMIKRAYLVAAEKHGGIFRKSGEPYIQHPIEVAYILAELQSGPATLAAGFLHDTVEDTDLTVEEIRNQFGDDVAFLVDSLTKIQRMKLSHRTEEDFEAEDHRKIFLGMAKDVRVILVKLADRLHNLRTLDALKPERQKALSQETLEVFTPIAHRLGIYSMQSEMEDLSLKRLEPEKYEEIVKLLNQKAKDRNSSVRALEKRIADLLFEKNIPFRMESRVKSVYSIYRKMYGKHHAFEEIYDVLAVRVITQTEMNCYEILGIVHATYTPVPGRFKDYIAMPKSNMYQSLHTTIVSGDGNTYEVQIRTEEMDEIAERGVAAHWRYKDGSNYNAKAEQKDIEDKLHWFRDFVSMSGENEDGNAKEYIDSLSHDIFSSSVYVFTPMGKVVDLPSGATTLDFAYKIHSKVGDSAVGATVNGVLVPLSYELKTGDICEIKTSKNSAGPNPGWLDIAKTSSALSKIRRAIQKKNADILRVSQIEKGKESLLDTFRQLGMGEGEMNKILDERDVLSLYGYKEYDDFYIAINNRNPAPLAVIDKLGLRKKEKALHITKKSSKDDKYPVITPGASNVIASLAKCCTPIPGDEIIGFISKGKGVIVHRKSCSHIQNTERLIPVEWKEDLKGSTFPCSIKIFAGDRASLVADILNALSAKKIPVQDLKAHVMKGTNNASITVTVYVADLSSLADVFASVKAVKGVYDVTRNNS